MKPAKANVCILVTNLCHDVGEFMSKRFPVAMTKGTCSFLLGGKMRETVQSLPKAPLSPAGYSLLFL